MQSISRWITQRHCLTLALMAAACVTSASAAELALAGNRWEKDVVTYWVNTQAQISDATLADVQTAIDEWNIALTSVPGAPTLAVAKNAKSADILMDLKLNGKFSRLGGRTVLLDGGVSTATAGCVLTAVHATMVGTLLKENPGRGTAAIRNVARGVIGRALGLAGINCGATSPPDYCATDVLDHHYLLNLIWSGAFDVEVEISDCDLAGIVEIYTPSSCDQIPASIPFACE